MDCGALGSPVPAIPALLHTNRYVGLGVGVVGLAATLWWQFRTRCYNPVAYWAAIAMVAVAGTTAADVLHAGLGVRWTCRPSRARSRSP